MKKLMALVLFVSATLSFTACSSDDNAPIRTNDKIEGTWYADQVVYSFAGEEHSRNFMELRGDDAVYETDILIIDNKNKATLKEHKKNIGSETITNGVVTKNNDKTFITLEKYNTNPREVVSSTATELKLRYKFTAKEGTEPMIVTYTKVKPEIKE